MNEDELNFQTRKFLKQLGIKSQQEIEKKIKQKFAEGFLDGIENLDISVLLEIKKIGLRVPIKGKIDLKKV